MSEFIIASSWLSRVRGLFFRKGYKGHLILVPCKDIHTYGMRREIDVAFLSHEGIILSTFLRVKPGSRLYCRDAYAVVERFSKDDCWYKEGTELKIKTINT